MRAGAGVDGGIGPAAIIFFAQARSIAAEIIDGTPIVLSSESRSSPARGVYSIRASEPKQPIFIRCLRFLASKCLAKGGGFRRLLHGTAPRAPITAIAVLDF
jgi:hypothetical protein